MIGASKILTVSYGTFSCTLEGFDEPFNTMKAIAEYFRDLAADDRYFGAEPPTPDAAMLHRIAEREVQRRVEAKIQDNGVILRARDAIEPQARPDAPVAAPAPAFYEDESVAAKLQRIRQAVARSAAPAVVVAAPVVVEEAVFVEDEHADSLVTAFAPAQPDTAPEPEPEPEAEAPADAPVEALRDAWQALDEAEAVAETEAELREVFEDTAFRQDDAPAHQPAALAEPEQDRSDDDAALIAAIAIEADVSDAGPVEPEAGPAAGFEAELAGDAASELPVDDQAAEDDAIAAAMLAEAMTEAEPTPAEPAIPQDVAVSVDTAEVEALVAAASDEAEAEEIEALMADLSVAGRAGSEKAEPADLPDTGFADDEDEPDAAPDALAAYAEAEEALADDPDTLEAEVLRELAALDAVEAELDAQAEAQDDTALADAPEADLVEDDLAAFAQTDADAPALSPLALTAALRADTDEDSDAEAALSPAAEKLRRARARVIKVKRDDAAAVLTADAEAELRRELDAVEADASRGGEREGRTILEANTKGDEDVSRLLRQTNTEMEGPENRRRMSTLAHLKAAVAATVAELRSPGSSSEHGETSRLDRYRADLARVVRPRRPGDAAPADRPAPLVLVSEQRIDRPVAANNAPARIMPRRVTSSGNLALDTGADEPELPEEDMAEAENIFGSSKNFIEFAERLGASELPDLLEAAAAYTACVEGRPHFSRPHLMRHVAAITEETDQSREDSMRSFGQLLRQGKIEKVKRGQFAITDNSYFLAEARRLSN